MDSSCGTFVCSIGVYPRIDTQATERQWYAVYTVPRNEKSVARHLDLREIEYFLPTYETSRIWKNRQRVKVVLPLFPTYVFVCIDRRQRTPSISRSASNCWQQPRTSAAAELRNRVSAVGFLQAKN